METYCWPVRKEDLEGFSLNESPAHNLSSLKYACDFIVPLDTLVLAMDTGQVEYVKQDSDLGGNDFHPGMDVTTSRFWNTGNRIEIHHGLGVYTAYEHLAQNSSLIEEGEIVQKRQPIAKTGDTGFMAHLGSHLHVERFYCTSKNPEEITTVRIYWENYDELQKLLWNHKRWLEIGNSRML